MIEDSLNRIREIAKECRIKWETAGQSVDDVGMRFRLFSRDGFSNVPREYWKKVALFGSYERHHETLGLHSRVGSEVDCLCCKNN